MIRLKSTCIPKDIKEHPTNNLSMEDIVTYWGQEDTNFDMDLYLKFIKTKIFTK